MTVINQVLPNHVLDLHRNQMPTLS